MSLLSQFLPKSGTTTNTIPIEIFGVGGGGGRSSLGGLFGGGAGQVVYQKLDVDIGITYPITIGAGGANGAPPSPGSLGGNTTFGHVTCFGGGGGVSAMPLPAPLRYPTNAFGSTGGNNNQTQEFSVHGCNTFIPSTWSPEGFRLQNIGSPAYPSGAGGGGGASQGAGYWFYEGVGSKRPTSANGYEGIPAEAIGISTIVVATGSNGPTNSGSGGSSGVLFVRYPTDYAAATVVGNSPAPSQPGYYVYRWNSGPGSITFNY